MQEDQNVKHWVPAFAGTATLWAPLAAAAEPPKLDAANTAIWSALFTWIILKVCDALLGMRVAQEHETEGLDTALHGEKGYNL